MTEKTIGIVGGGAWGTALACVLAREKQNVLLWALEKETATAINAERENTRFLPGIPLPGNIRATNLLADMNAADVIFLVTPAQHLRKTCETLAPHWPHAAPAVICSKGIEQESRALLSDVAGSALPDIPISVLSGPSFATEVAAGNPTALTLACPEEELGHHLLKIIGTKAFRPYYSPDRIGVQVGGATKNVLAIAGGIVEGRKWGANARAALISRGLAEVVRFAVAMGGETKTVMGLAGTGDLVLTATSGLSRNFSLGVALGEGRRLEDILGERHCVTEGVTTAAAIVDLATSHGVDMPICQAVNSVLHKNASVDVAIDRLLSRPFGREWAGLT